MDTGHYNCRDYSITPHPAPVVISSAIPSSSRYKPHHHYQPAFHRHESFEELEQRSRSPASSKPKFPLLRLPLELRQQILSYLLPRTKELAESNPLTRHAREFSAVQKRVMKGMSIQAPPTVVERTQSPSLRQAAIHGFGGGVGISQVVWQRGNTALFSVCRQMHDECAEMVYGGNTFLLFLTYAGIKWRYRWLLPSGLAPTRNYDFLELVPERYRRLLKRVVVHIDHVDSYTGMIKFNVSGRGLVHGLRRQVQRLVNSLKAVEDNGAPNEDDHERFLTKLSIRISNSSAVSEQLNRQSGFGEPRASEDIAIMLEPFRQLHGVREASVAGAVTDEFASELEARLRSMEKPELVESVDVDGEDGGLGGPVKGLCVYGNDI